MKNIKSILNRFAKEQSGEGFLDVAMKMLIVVVIGAAVLAILNTAMPTLFDNLIDKIANVLGGINVLPTP